MFARIFLPIAEAEDTSDTISAVIALARAFSSQVTVFHARERIVAAHSTTEQESIRESVDFANQVVKLLTDGGIQASAVIESTRPDRLADLVLLKAEESEADLIVVGGHHAHNLRESVLGDIGKVLAHRAHCPVLMMPSVDPD